jgi:hypothetical protein
VSDPLVKRLCAVCGEHVGRSGMEAFKEWEDLEGNVLGREVVVLVHKACYMSLSPAERAALFARDDESA